MRQDVEMAFSLSGQTAGGRPADMRAGNRFLAILLVYDAAVKTRNAAAGIILGNSGDFHR